MRRTEARLTKACDDTCCVQRQRSGAPRAGRNGLIRWSGKHAAMRAECVWTNMRECLRVQLNLLCVCNSTSFACATQPPLRVQLAFRAREC
eukprot:2247937-Pleurochrysis_carterae.AAC.1